MASAPGRWRGPREPHFLRNPPPPPPFTYQDEEKFRGQHGRRSEQHWDARDFPEYPNRHLPPPPHPVDRPYGSCSPPLPVEQPFHRGDGFRERHPRQTYHQHEDPRSQRFVPEHGDPHQHQYRQSDQALTRGHSEVSSTRHPPISHRPPSPRESRPYHRPPCENALVPSQRKDLGEHRPPSLRMIPNPPFEQRPFSSPPQRPLFAPSMFEHLKSAELKARHRFSDRSAPPPGSMSHANSDQPHPKLEAEAHPVREGRPRPLIPDRLRPLLDHHPHPPLDHRLLSSLDDRSPSSLDSQARLPMHNPPRPALNQQHHLPLDGRRHPLPNNQQRPLPDHPQRPLRDHRQRPLPDHRQRPLPDHPQRPLPDHRQRPLQDNRPRPSQEDFSRRLLDDRPPPLLNSRHRPLLDEGPRPPRDGYSRPLLDEPPLPLLSDPPHPLREDQPRPLLHDNTRGRRPHYEERIPARREENREFSHVKGMDQARIPEACDPPLPKRLRTHHFSDSELSRDWNRSGSSRRISADGKLQSSGNQPSVQNLSLPLPPPPVQGDSVFKRLDRAQRHSSPKTHLPPHSHHSNESFRPSIMERLGQPSLRRQGGNPTVKPLYPNPSPGPSRSLPDLRDELNARHGNSFAKSSPQEQRTSQGRAKERATPFSPGGIRHKGGLPSFTAPTSEDVREGTGADGIQRKLVRGGMMRTDDDSGREHTLELKKHTTPSGTMNGSEQHSASSRGYLNRSQRTQMERQDTGLADGRHLVARSGVNFPEPQSQCTTKNHSIVLDKEEPEVRDSKQPLARRESTSQERTQLRMTGSHQSAQLKKEDSELKSTCHSTVRRDFTSQERQQQDLSRSQSAQLEKDPCNLKNSGHSMARRESTSQERQQQDLTRSQSNLREKDQNSESITGRHPVTRRDSTSSRKPPQHVTRIQGTQISKQGFEVKNTRTNGTPTTTTATTERGQEEPIKLLEKQRVEVKDGGRLVRKRSASSSEKQCGVTFPKTKDTIRYVTRGQMRLRRKQDSSPETSEKVSTVNGSVAEHKVQDGSHDSKQRTKGEVSVCKKTDGEQTDLPSFKTSKHSTCVVSKEKSSPDAQHAPSSLEGTSLEESISPLVTVVSQRESMEKPAPGESKGDEKPCLSLGQHHDPLMEVDFTLSGSSVSMETALPFADFDSSSKMSVDSLRTIPSNSITVEMVSSSKMSVDTLKTIPSNNIPVEMVLSSTSLVCHATSLPSKQTSAVPSSQLEKGSVPSKKLVALTSTQFEDCQDMDRVVSAEEKIKEEPTLAQDTNRGKSVDESTRRRPTPAQDNDGVKSSEEGTVKGRSSPLSMNPEERDAVKAQEKDKAEVSLVGQLTNLQKECTTPVQATLVQSTAEPVTEPARAIPVIGSGPLPSSDATAIPATVMLKEVPPSDVPSVSRPTPLIQPPPTLPAKVESTCMLEKRGKPHFLELANKVCGEGLVQRLEDCGLPVHPFNRSPFDFFYSTTVDALKKFQKRTFTGLLDGLYYICRMARGFVCPAQSFRNLFELELRVLKELCGPDVKLWCYHIINYRKMVMLPKKSGVEVILHVFQCVMPQLQKPAVLLTANSSLAQFGPNCQEMTARVLGPQLLFKLLGTRLPGHANQTPLPVLLIAIHCALAQKWKDHFVIKAAAFREYFVKNMPEYEMGKLCFPQTLDSVREAEICQFKNLCGEDVKLWCYHVLRYTGLVGMHPVHGKRTRNARNGYANLVAAEIVKSIIRDLPFHHISAEPFHSPGTDPSSNPFKLLQQLQPCSLAKVKRKSTEFGIPANSFGGIKKTKSNSSLEQRVIVEAGGPQNLQHQPKDGKTSNIKSESPLDDKFIQLPTSESVQGNSFVKPFKGTEEVDDHSTDSGCHGDIPHPQKEKVIRHIPSKTLANVDSQNKELPSDKSCTPCSNVSTSQKSHIDNWTSSAQQPLSVTPPRSVHESLPTSVHHNLRQRKTSRGNFTAKNTAAPPALTSSSQTKERARTVSLSASDLKASMSDTCARSQKAAHDVVKPNAGASSSSLATARPEPVASSSVPPPLGTTTKDCMPAMRKESPELGEVNSPESGEVFSPDPSQNPCQEEAGLEPGEIVSPFLQHSPPEPGEIFSPNRSPDHENVVMQDHCRDASNLGFEAIFQHSELRECPPHFWGMRERIPQREHYLHPHNSTQPQGRWKRNWSPIHRRWSPPRRSRSPPRRHSRRHYYSPPPERRARSRSPPSSRRLRGHARGSILREPRPRRGSHSRRRSVGNCASDDEVELRQLREEALLSMINRTCRREEEKKETSSTRGSLPPLTPQSDMSECSVLSDTILCGQSSTPIASDFSSVVDDQQAYLLKEAALESIASSLLGIYNSAQSTQKSQAYNMYDAALTPITSSSVDVCSLQDSKETIKPDIHEEVVQTTTKDNESAECKSKMVPGTVQAQQKTSTNAAASEPPMAPARTHTFPLAARQRLSLLKQEESRSGGSSRSGSPHPQGGPRRSSSAVQVFTSKNSTWKVSEFKIHTFLSDSSSSDELETEAADVNNPSDHSALSMMIHLFRKASETTSGVEAVLSPPAALAAPSPNVTPSPVSRLPPKKQHEYKELKRKLEEHQQRQSRKRKVPDDAEVNKLVPEQQTRPVDSATEKKRTKMEEERRLAQRLAEQEKERKKTLQRYHLEMDKCRTAVEGNKKVLSSLTHSLTDCETTMEEYELKIRLFKEKLKSAESELKECEMKKSSLKSKLRQIKGELDSNTTFMRQLEQKIAAEEESLSAPLLTALTNSPEHPPPASIIPSPPQPHNTECVTSGNLLLPSLETEDVSDAESFQDLSTTADLSSSVSMRTVPAQNSVGSVVQVASTASSVGEVLPYAEEVVELVTESEAEENDSDQQGDMNSALSSKQTTMMPVVETDYKLVPKQKTTFPFVDSVVMFGAENSDTDSNEKMDLASADVPKEEAVQDVAVCEPSPTSLMCDHEIETKSSAEAMEVDEEITRNRSLATPLPAGQNISKESDEIPVAIADTHSCSDLLGALMLHRPMLPPVVKPSSRTLSAMLLIDQTDRAKYLSKTLDPIFVAAKEEMLQSEDAKDELVAAGDDSTSTSSELPVIVISDELAQSLASASMFGTMPRSPTMSDSAPSSPGNVMSPGSPGGTLTAKQKRMTKKVMGAGSSKKIEKALLLERVTKRQKEILEMRHGLMSALVHKKKAGEGRSVPKVALRLAGPTVPTVQVTETPAPATWKGELKPRKKMVERGSPSKAELSRAETSGKSVSPRSSCQKSDKAGKLTVEILSLLQLDRKKENQFLNELKSRIPHWKEEQAPIPLTPLTLATIKGIIPGSQRKQSVRKIPPPLLQQVLALEQSKFATSPSSLPTAKYSAYSSPLLMMGSYRLNPYYRTLFKLPLTSLTYSHKMDPNRFMCKYELQGRCTDTKCPAQHLRDITPSVDEVVTDLSSMYCQEVKSSNVARKSGPAAEMVSQIQGFGGKLSDEELLTLVAHTVHKNVAKSLGGAFSCTAVDNTRPSSIAVKEVEEEAIPPLIDTRRVISVLIDAETEPQPVVSMATKSCGASSRYFSSTYEGEVASPDTPIDHTYLVKQLKEARKREDIDEVMAIVEKLILQKPVAEEVCVECLDVVASIQAEKISDGDREALIQRITTVSPTYCVYWKVISIVTSVPEKLDWIGQAYQTLISQLKQDGTAGLSTYSHHILELVFSAASLYLASGHQQQALEVLQSMVANERTTPPPEQTIPTLDACSRTSTTGINVFRNVGCWLDRSDCLFLGLCYLYLLACSHLPFCITSGKTGSCSAPIRISSKKPFLIPWKNDPVDKGVSARIMTTFKVFMQLCTDKQLSPADNILCCLPLYINMFLFEISQGFTEHAQNSLEQLLEQAPHCLELWLFANRLAASQRNLNLAREKLVRGTQMCPKEPLLYYRLALLELVMESESFVEKALHWLDKCLEIFYQFSPGDEERTLDYILLLYRRLLGQFVPYTFSPPPFSDRESMSGPQLGNHLIPVWLCYCLVVELTSLPGDETSDEATTYSCSLEEAFESAVHSVHRDQEGLRVLWMEYLTYRQARACGPAASLETVRQYIDCAKRSMLAVNGHAQFPYQIAGQPSEYEDYTFHNHVADTVFESVLLSSQLVMLALKLIKAQPGNLFLMDRLAEYVLKNEEVVEQGKIIEESHSLQSLLISYCYKHPDYLPLWQRVIQLEIKRSHFREARWMFRQASKSSPLDALLWSQYLIFELQRVVEGGGQSNLSLIRPLIEKCEKLGVEWRGFSSILQCPTH